jgi:hypothetical protein
VGAVASALSDLAANKTLRDTLKRGRWLLGLVLLWPLALFMKPERLPAAVAISLFGQLIQTWCFASLVKNRELTIRGPYLLVRNPMYLGRYFLLLGFVWLSGGWAAVALFTVLYWIYMAARVKREETRLRRKFGEGFARYCAEVARFWPRPGRLGQPGVWFFDWGMFRENHAHWNLLATLLAFAATIMLHRWLT